MSFFKSLSAVAVLAAATSAANAAITLNWVAIPIPADASTVGNATINGKLPAGAWNSYELRATITEGDRFGGGALRATAATGGFYRHTIVDPDEIEPAINFDLTRLLPGVASNPARGLSTGVAYPGNPTGTSILGALRADGTQGPSSESVAPNGVDGTSAADNLVSLVWGNAAPSVQPGDGTFAIARLTFLGDTVPAIGQGSVANRILGAGGTGPGVPIPQIPPIPEPTMGFALAGLGLLGLRRRK